MRNYNPAWSGAWGFLEPDGFLFSSGLKISWDLLTWDPSQLVVCMLHTLTCLDWKFQKE